MEGLTRTRTIIHEPGVGRKLARGFGISSFILSLLSLALIFVVAYAENTPVNILAFFLVFIVAWIIVSMVIVVASEPKKEVITEEIEENNSDDDNDANDKNDEGVWRN